MQKLFGHIISLTKNIWLTKPGRLDTAQTKFIPAIFVYSQNPPCITWWTTKITNRVLNEYSTMLCDDHPELDTQDIREIGMLIEASMRLLCCDPDLFMFNKLVNSSEKSLFDCRAIKNPALFAEVIHKWLINRIQTSIVTWAGMCVAPNVNSKSFSIPQEGLYVIAKEDLQFWRDEIESRFLTNEWAPIHDHEANLPGPAYSKLHYSNIFISTSQGTKFRARTISSINIRQLFAVIFGIITTQTLDPLHKAGGDPCSVWLQYPSHGKNAECILVSGTYPLLPYYLNSYSLTTETINEIKTWYSTLNSVTSKISSRIRKSSNFINRAMNSNNIEAYLNYFISLDALFGQPFSVQDSILRGCNLLTLPLRLHEKISWLLQLRHELVHGGSRFVSEWPEYSRYRAHFGTEPSDDIRLLAFHALVQSPGLPPTAYE